MPPPRARTAARRGPGARGRPRTPGRARAGRRLRRARSTRDVVERALVRAAPAQLVGQRLVGHVQQVGVVLPPRPVVPRDHARDGLGVGDRLAHADGDVLAGAEPPATRLVLDLDRDRTDAERPARLPRPWEVHERGTVPRAGEDGLERWALALVRTLVEVEEEVPRRARLVVVVAARQHGREPGEVDVARVAALDRPRQRALADAVGRAPPAAAADAPAGADRVAVAGLEVGARDPPVGVLARHVGRRYSLAPSRCISVALPPRDTTADARR